MISIICWQIVYISKTVAIFMTDPVSSQEWGGGGVRRQIKARNLVSESIQNRCHGNIFFSDWLSYLHSGRLTYFFPFKSCNWVTRIIRLLFRTRGINIKPILINAQTFFPRSWNQEKLIKIDLISLVMYTNSYLCILLVMSDIFLYWSSFGHMFKHNYPACPVVACDMHEHL